MEAEKKSKIIFLTLGVLLGTVISMGGMGIYVTSNADKLMINVGESKYDFLTTIDELNQSIIEADDWKVVTTMNMTKSLAAHGFEINNIFVLELCNPVLANDMLGDEDNLWMGAMMPCRMAVYEKSDGKTYVASMNMGLMSNMFPGDIGDAMAQVALDDEEILEAIFA